MGMGFAGGKQAGVLTPARGGTGVDGSSAAAGALLIGTGAGFAIAQIQGTANQVIVTNGSGSIMLSLPQNIHTGATPTFAGMTLTGPLVGEKTTLAYNGSNGDPILLVTDASTNVFLSVFANGSGHTMIRNGTISFESINGQAAWLLNSDGFGYFAGGVALRDSVGNPTSKLTSNGVGIAALSNATNPTALRVFNTTDSASSPTNAEWLESKWAGNVCTIQTAKSGTGALRDLNITSSGSGAMNITSNGSQTNFSQAGTLLTMHSAGFFLSSGQAIGWSTSGSIPFAGTIDLSAFRVGAGVLGLAQNATGGVGEMRVFGTTDSVSGAPANSEYFRIYYDGSYNTITSGKTGTGTSRPIRITGGTDLLIGGNVGREVTFFDGVNTPFMAVRAGPGGSGLSALSMHATSGWLQWGSVAYNSTGDLYLARAGAAGTLGIHDGTNPAGLRIYNTTDILTTTVAGGAPTDAEWLDVSWAANYCTISTTKSGAGSTRGLDVQCNYFGNVVWGNLGAGGINLTAGGGLQVLFNGVEWALNASSTLGWSGHASFPVAATRDVNLARHGAGVLGVFQTSTGLTSAALRVYNATDGANGLPPTNAEWIETAWAANVCTIQTAKTGTGTVRALKLNGTTLTFQSGGTDRWQIDTNGHLLASTDVSWDIGQNATNRPRFIYANGFAAAGVGGAQGEIRLGNGSSAGDLRFQVGFMQVGSDFRMQWSATNPYVATEFDLSRVGVRVLGLSAGTSAASLRVFNTTDSATAPANAEWLGVSWAANVCTIGTTAVGTGSSRALTVVCSGGNLTLQATGGGIVMNHGGGFVTLWNTAGPQLAASNGVNFSSNSTLGSSGSLDLGVYRQNAAGVLGVLNPSSLSSSAAIRIYNTADSTTSQTNAEWLEIFWSSSVAYLGTASSGTGVARSLQIQSAGDLFFQTGGGSAARFNVEGGYTSELKGAGFKMYALGAFAWVSNPTIASALTPDTYMLRTGAGGVGIVKDAAGGSASLRIYNTTDDTTGPGTNAEWLEFSWASNVCSIKPAKAGTGTVRRVRHYYTATVFDASGSGSPNGAVTADPGSTYRDEAGGAGVSFYVKESGVGTNTGWVAK